MSSFLKVEKEMNGECCQLYIKGVLDYGTLNQFDETINEIDFSINKLILNVKELDFIDSTGVGAILNIIHLSIEHDFKVEFQEINEEIDEIFETIGVYKVLSSF